MICIQNRNVEIRRFPDMTLNMKLDTSFIPEDYDNKEDPIVITWYYENDSELFQLLCIKRHLELNYTKDTSFYLKLPYVPNARMDRVKNEEIEVFTLKYFCEFINSLNFDLVIISDPHSNVAPALLNNCYISNDIEYYTNTALEMAMQDTNSISTDDFVFCFPDEGAMKRYVNKCNNTIPYVFGVKNRNWETGNIDDLMIINKELVKGKKVLIIDDICSRGGTFYYTAQALKAAGAEEIFLYVTHCENTIHKGELQSSGLINAVFTTNSIYKISEKYDGFVTII